MANFARGGAGRQSKNKPSRNGTPRPAVDDYIHGPSAATLDLSSALPDTLWGSPPPHAAPRDDAEPESVEEDAYADDEAEPETEQDDLEAVAQEDHGPGGDVAAQQAWQVTRGGRRTSIPHWVPAVVAELGEALVLGRLAYWFDYDAKKGEFRARLQFDGYTWAAETYAQMGAKIGRTELQVKTAVRSLRKKGFVVDKQRKSPYHQYKAVRHYRLDWARIGAELEAKGWRAPQDDAD